jgi:hypothetical protein
MISDAASVAPQLTRCTLEYLASLRDRITEGAFDQQYESHEKYLDAVGFWKAQNNESRSRIQELEYENMKLEERNVRLSKETGNGERQSERESSVLWTTSAKRGQEQALGTPSNCPTKKAKRDGHDLRLDGTLNEDVGALDNTDAGKSEHHYGLDQQYVYPRCYQDQSSSITCIAHTKATSK